MSSEGWGVNDIPFYGSQSRTILIMGEITEDTTARVMGQLFQLNAESNEEPIYVHLCTEGGNAYAGRTIYDALKIIEAPVIIIVMGICMSAGLLILSAGDLRLSSPNSSFFYHQVCFSEIEIACGEQAASIADAYRSLQEDYDEKIRSRTKMKPKTWAKEFAGRTSKFFTPEEALQYNIIDSILPTKAKINVKTTG